MFSYLKLMQNIGTQILQRSRLHILSNTSLVTSTKAPLESSLGAHWSLVFMRTNIRDKFPRPKECKRLKVHGWKTRMQTPEGRRVLMRRILKGRHVLSH